MNFLSNLRYEMREFESSESRHQDGIRKRLQRKMLGRQRGWEGHQITTQSDPWEGQKEGRKSPRQPRSSEKVSARPQGSPGAKVLPERTGVGVGWWVGIEGLPGIPARPTQDGCCLGSEALTQIQRRTQCSSRGSSVNDVQ